MRASQEVQWLSREELLRLGRVAVMNIAAERGYVVEPRPSTVATADRFLMAQDEHRARLAALGISLEVPQSDAED